MVVAGDGNGIIKHLPHMHKLLRAPIPIEMIYGFIHKMAHKIPNSNYYLIDMSAYKKATYCDVVVQDQDQCQDQDQYQDQDQCQYQCQYQCQDQDQCQVQDQYQYQDQYQCQVQDQDNLKHKPSLLQQFCNELMPYYCKDKHFFLTRKMSYSNLNTILRQVCRHASIECKPERKYDKSKTQIVYHICDTPMTN